MKKIFIILTLVWFGFITNVFSADFDKGLDAANSGDYVTALKEWRPLAEQGHAGAQNNLGVLYSNGNGVLQDYQEAVKWFRLSAEQGNVNAQNSLGSMYDNGEGVIEDDKEAVKWYRLAAEQGDDEAQTSLGVMYALGTGVIEDIVLAHMWWNIAASQGHEGAKKNKDIIVKEMTASQIEEAQRLARQCVNNNHKGC
jgi:TPR repeat protein